MADANVDSAQAALIIRRAPDKLIGLALGSLAYGVVGVLMLTLPPPAGGSPIVAGVGGISALLLGLVGLGTTAHVTTRPLLLLYPDWLVDVRRGLTIPLVAIRQIAQVSPTAQPAGLARWLSPQWLLLTLHDPSRYAALETLSKRSGLSDADLTLDLSLASAADYVRAYQFIRARMPPGDTCASGAGREGCDAHGDAG